VQYDTYCNVSEFLLWLGLSMGHRTKFKVGKYYLGANMLILYKMISTVAAM
jgi:hypothetical protein